MVWTSPSYYLGTQKRTIQVLLLPCSLVPRWTASIFISLHALLPNSEHVLHFFRVVSPCVMWAMVPFPGSSRNATGNTICSHCSPHLFTKHLTTLSLGCSLLYLNNIIRSCGQLLVNRLKCLFDHWGLLSVLWLRGWFLQMQRIPSSAIYDLFKTTYCHREV